MLPSFCDSQEITDGYHVSLCSNALLLRVICKPLTYHSTMTPSIAYRSVITVWLVSILVSFMSQVIPIVASLSPCDNSMRMLHWAGLYLSLCSIFRPNDTDHRSLHTSLPGSFPIPQSA